MYCICVERDALRAFQSDPELYGALETLVRVYTAQEEVGQALRSLEEVDAAGGLDASARMLLARLRQEHAKATAATPGAKPPNRRGIFSTKEKAVSPP